MATKDEEKKARDEKEEAEAEEAAEAEARAEAQREEEKAAEEKDEDEQKDDAKDPEESATDKRESEAKAESEEDPEEEARKAVSAATPNQLGFRRFVYAAYLAGAIGISFMASKLVTFVWHKLAGWKPNFGEPRDEITMPIAAVLGIGIALILWRRNKTRRMAEEIAEELSKVTWPSRKEVVNGTTIVIVSTLMATVFFALMDRFWGFVTDKVYGM